MNQKIKVAKIHSMVLENKITDIKNSVINYNRLNPNLNFENFVTGTSNNLSFLSAKKACSQLSRYNPLFIYGGVGLGKNPPFECYRFRVK